MAEQEIQKTGILTRTEARQRRLADQGYSRRPRILTHVLLIIICVVVAFPALYALQVATLTAEESLATNPPNLFPPSNDLLENIRQVFESENFDDLLLNTTIVTMVVVIGKTATAMLAGLAFVYYRFPGKWVLFFVILLTLLMPTEIILLPLFNLVGELEWARTNPKLALTMPFIPSAIGAFLFRQHFNNIPREMVEAAQIDGASPMRFMTSILLPMSWNIIGAMAVVQFIYMWHQYLWPLYVLAGNEEDQMIQVGVREVGGLFGSQQDYGALMAAGLVASIPPVIVFVLLQKQFMSGFAITRDK